MSSAPLFPGCGRRQCPFLQGRCTASQGSTVACDQWLVLERLIRQRQCLGTQAAALRPAVGIAFCSCASQVLQSWTGSWHTFGFSHLCLKEPHRWRMLDWQPPHALTQGGWESSSASLPNYYFSFFWVGKIRANSDTPTCLSGCKHTLSVAQSGTVIPQIHRAEQNKIYTLKYTVTCNLF